MKRDRHAETEALSKSEQRLRYLKYHKNNIHTKNQLDSLLIDAEDNYEALLFAIIKQACLDYITLATTSSHYGSAKLFLESNVLGMSEEFHSYLMKKLNEERKERYDKKSKRKEQTN